MTISPDSIRLRPEQRARCSSLLAHWDQRDPWGTAQQQLGAQLLGLAFEICAPRVPRLSTPEAAAKFIREALASTDGQEAQS